MTTKTWIRRSLIGVALVAVALAGAVGAGLALAEHKNARRFEIAAVPVALPSDAAALERGRYLYESRGCGDCHGADGGGRLFVNEPSIRLAGPDITRGGAAANYRAVDWVRSLRHGVAPSGRPLRVMPSEDYNRLTDADLGAIVAYVQQLPPQRGAGPVVELPLPARLLFGFGLIDAPADRIDHRLPPQAPVPEAPTVEHGRYVAQMCIGCHGKELNGGRIPGAPPAWPAAANLTPGTQGAMGRYPDAEAFATMMRSGRRPDGSRIGIMPFDALAKMNRTDLDGLHAYLRTLPAREFGIR